jgi:hypothetical protein
MRYRYMVAEQSLRERSERDTPPDPDFTTAVNRWGENLPTQVASRRGEMVVASIEFPDTHHDNAGTAQAMPLYSYRCDDCDAEGGGCCGGPCGGHGMH